MRVILLSVFLALVSMAARAQQEPGLPTAPTAESAEPEAASTQEQVKDISALKTMLIEMQRIERDFLRLRAQMNACTEVELWRKEAMGLQQQYRAAQAKFNREREIISAKHWSDKQLNADLELVPKAAALPEAAANGQ